MSTETREAQAQERKAQRLEAVADWFTDCKNLTLESLPAGLIADLRAGAAALRAPRETGWQQARDALKLARKVTNTWACVARSKRDGDAIFQFHQDIKEAEAALPPAPRPQETE